METELKELQNLEKQIADEDEEYLSDKLTFRPDLKRADAFLIFKGSLAQHLHRVFHEYDMNLMPYGDKEILRCQLSPLQLKYVQAATAYLCKESTLNPLATFSGKSAEMIFRNSINNLFNLFRLKKRIHLNCKNYLYGGDGGADFFVGNLALDVKVRNESPAHGMILNRSFIERALDSTILIHVTNSTNIRLGDEIPKNKTLPLSLSGWLTVAEFKERAGAISNGRDSLAVDKFNSIVDLLLLMIEDQIKAEELFTYGA